MPIINAFVFTLLTMMLVNNSIGGDSFDHHFNSIIVNNSIFTEDKLISRVTKEGGWELPELNFKDSISAVQKVTINEIEIDKTTYSLIGDLLVNIEAHKIDGDKLTIKNWKYYLKGLYSYKASKSKSIFAYEMVLTPALVDSQGQCARVGGLVLIRYYDEDGDGKFETRVFETQNVVLPSWVKS